MEVQGPTETLKLSLSLPVRGHANMSYFLCARVQYDNIHCIRTRSIVWLLEPLSVLQLSNQICWVDARIGCLGSTEDLPAGHSKWPLHKIQTTISTGDNPSKKKSIIHLHSSTMWMALNSPFQSIIRVLRSWTHHIGFLWEYSISHTLISHPLYR